MQFAKIITTRQTGGLHLAYKARFSSRDSSPTLSHSFKPIAACHPQALKRPLVLLTTLKRVLVFFFSYFVHRYIVGFLFPDIFCYCSFIQANCTHVISFCPKMAVSKLIFQVAYLSNIIKLLLPFKYPINCDTLYFGGILTSMCTWSGIKCPSIISTPL